MHEINKNMVVLASKKNETIGQTKGRKKWNLLELEMQMELICLN